MMMMYDDDGVDDEDLETRDQGRMRLKMFATAETLHQSLTGWGCYHF